MRLLNLDSNDQLSLEVIVSTLRHYYTNASFSCLPNLRLFQRCIQSAYEQRLIRRLSSRPSWIFRN